MAGEASILTLIRICLLIDVIMTAFPCNEEIGCYNSGYLMTITRVSRQGVIFGNYSMQVQARISAKSSYIYLIQHHAWDFQLAKHLQVQVGCSCQHLQVYTVAHIIMINQHVYTSRITIRVKVGSVYHVNVLHEYSDQ